MDFRKKILIKLKKLELNYPEINFKYKVNFRLSSKESMGEYSMNNDIFYFNMEICEKAGFAVYEEIIIHEFSHMIINYKYGKKVLVHGKEWKSVMRKLNSKNISATVDFNKYIDTNIKVSCNCQDHYISKNRLTRLRNGRNYKCKLCRTSIKEV